MNVYNDNSNVLVDNENGHNSIINVGTTKNLLDGMTVYSTTNTLLFLGYLIF
jgi:hypothetical protein